MKKMIIYLFLLCCAFLFSACTSNSYRTTFFSQDERMIIRPYFEAFISGVNNQDEHAVRSLFAAPINSDSALAEQIEATFSYLPTPLSIMTSATGCHSSSIYSDEIQRTEIDEIFTVECNNQVFYVAMKICSEDSSNSDATGIISIYFINSQDYHGDVYYRGDGKWTPGINLQ